MEKFTNSWNPPYKPSTTDKISDSLHDQGPLKPRLREGTHILASQKTKLDGIISKMDYHDQKMLRDVARAKQSGNMYQAKTLANELAQARETKKMMQSLRVMIEKTEHRFVAYDGIGDMAVTIEPIIVLMKNLKSSLRGFLPGVTSEVTEMTEMLGSYMSQTQNQIEFNVNTSSLTLDVENIMSEAAAVASDSVNARLPSTPAEVNRVTTSNNTI